MGPNHRPAANSRRSGVQTCTYLNSTYSYLPAASIPRDRLRSRPPRRNCPLVPGAHLTKNPLKFPSTGPTQPHHNRHNNQPRYPYPPATHLQERPAKQEENSQTFLSTQTRRQRETPNSERQVPVNRVRPPSVSSPAKQAVAMVFVPEQPAKRAMEFEPSLFQRNDSPATPPQSYQRMPLSELIIPPNISSNRYMPPRSPLRGSSPCQEKPPWKIAPRPPRRPYVQPPPSPMPPLSPPSSRREHSSQENSSRFIRRYPREEDEVIPKAPLKHGRPSPAAPPLRPSRK